jgi:hypothetical protein
MGNLVESFDRANVASIAAISNWRSGMPAELFELRRSNVIGFDSVAYMGCLLAD